MKIAICTIAYNEADYIAACIKQFQRVGDFHHLVLVSAKPWNGLPANYDGTVEIARKAGAEAIVRYWATEAEQRNWGLAYLYDYDYVLIVDPDEFFLKEDILKILKRLNDPYDYQNRTRQLLPCFVPENIITYWKTTDYIFSPPDRHLPIIAVDPTQSRFSEHRQVQPFDGSNPYLEPQTRLDITCHHLSWVRSDEKVREKIESYSHSGVIPSHWYEEAWKKWEPNSEINVRPYGKEISQVVYSPLPLELKNFLDSLK